MHFRGGLLGAGGRQRLELLVGEGDLGGRDVLLQVPHL